MHFKDYIKTSFRNLSRRKLRTFLTSFAVAIGTMLIIIMVSLGVGTQNLVINSLKEHASITQIMVSPYKDIGTIEINMTTEDQKKWEENRKKNFKKLTQANLDKIKKIENVSDIKSLLYAQITKTQIGDKSGSSTTVEGYDLKYGVFSPSEIEAVKLKEKNKNIKPIIAGRDLNADDKDTVLIGQNYLKKMGITDYNSVIGKDISMAASLPQSPGTAPVQPLIIKAKIAGVISDKFSGAGSIIMSIDMAAKIQGYYKGDPNYFDNNGPDQLIVNAKSFQDVKTIADKIKKMGYGIQTYQSVLDQIKNMFAIFQGILAIGGIIVLFVAAIGVINTMIMSIYERTRSIGIMKAVGASKSNIKNLFLVESGSLGFIGGIMGILFGWFGTKILGFVFNIFIKSKGGTPTEIFSIPLWLVLGSLAFSILVTVTAGLYPAARAAKLDPIEALRYE
ncbi:FtsX-like permease family protein [Thermoanaerobacterium sp. RBIITD]|uniref:ABC transporter permease n=1 Tax=Thermoanaerobacterium sp. RBIITD TaxID=1550240 RepID=UPI000BBF6383|nr:FtsX-like permease family protein [Thermoanaerobacterium sp. RBIITD]SNX53964.1 putative ABC transport system permease protein [Thermoanaerobacterium sp. RBIITD]